MDSREQGAATLTGGLREQPPQIISGLASSHYPFNSVTISANPTVYPSSTLFPFNSITSSPLAHQQNQQQQLKSLDSLNSLFVGPLLFRHNINSEPNMRKKRGRPRKYVPDGSASMQVAPTTPIVYIGGRDSSTVAATESPAKRNRGRPPGSGKKQIAASSGTGGGVGFTTHLITVRPGEDIVEMLLGLSRQRQQTVFILSANGVVSNFTLTRPSFDAKFYQGQYEIVSLSGSSIIFGNDEMSRMSRLSIAIAASDDTIVGGAVLGALRAATPVHVIVGSFNVDHFQVLTCTTPNAKGGPSTRDGSSHSSDDRDASTNDPPILNSNIQMP